MDALLLKLSQARSEYLKAVADDTINETELRSLNEAVFNLETELQTTLKDKLAKDKEADAPVETEQRNADVPNVELRNYIAAAVEGRQVSGAEKELLEERNLIGVDGIIPWEAIAPRETEQRADAETSVAAAALGSTQMNILPRIFNRTGASHLGVMMPMVSRGDAVYSVLTGGDAGAIKAQGVEHDAVAAVFTGQTIKPTRLTARYVIAVEDMARFNSLEDTLRADLRSALGVQLDNQIINGSGTAPNLKGLVKSLGTVKKADAEADYAGYKAVVSGGVDGKYAGMMSDVRVLIGQQTFNHAISKENAASGETGYEVMQRFTNNGVLVSAQLPAKDGDKNQRILRTTMGSDAIAPIWEGVQLIRDPYSKAQAGEVSLTAIMLAGFSLLRTDAFGSLKLQIEA